MGQHFCTCRDFQCQNHPHNHTQGCDPCIQKNLKNGEIPVCFFRTVSPEISGLKQYTFESFAEFVLKHKDQTKP